MGCSKNLVDSERLMRMLADVGYDVADAASDEFIGSDGEKIVVINTCGFIGDAKEESVNEILAWCEAKMKAQSMPSMSWAVCRNAMPMSFRRKSRRLTVGMERQTGPIWFSIL